MPGLGTTFGRGGATTALQDLANSDCIFIIGSSMAEAHPVGFRFVLEAREKGATVIHVDPRYARTSAHADIWAPLRVGSDGILLGALVSYVLEHERWFREYVAAYTNATMIVADDYTDSEDGDGLFSGWDEERGIYHPSPPPSWQIDPSRRDPSMTHPRCVLQIMRRHFARYTPELVESSCGIPREMFVAMAEALCQASGPDRTAAFCYAVGLTQHTSGVQIIRTLAILQLLLGNIGRPGGGIMALRGHASIQGSTDIPTLYNNLPGYLPMPTPAQATLGDYIGAHRPARGGWSNLDRSTVSLLKAWYGDSAHAGNDFGFDHLPRIDGDHSHFAVVDAMLDDKVAGYFIMGENPVVGSINGRLQHAAAARLDWLVVRDLVMIETATFWKDSPQVEEGGLRSEDIATEVFFFPAASHIEKEGTFTQTQRVLQWRDKAIDPPGDCRSDAWFVYELGKRLKARAAASDDPRDAGLRALTWDYGWHGPHGDPDVEAILREINGYHVAPPDSEGGANHPSSSEGGEPKQPAPPPANHSSNSEGGEPKQPATPPANHSSNSEGGEPKQITGFHELAADGSTACGCWIYSGVFPERHRNRARERQARTALGHGWGFAWPADRRILYNRASARPDGRPWSERKKLVWWDEAAQRWTGLDTPDCVATHAPSYVPPEGAEGLAALPGDAPFVMHEDGLGRLFVPRGLADGPLPVHYEPLESVAPNPLHRKQPTNPLAKRYNRAGNRLAEPIDPRFPYALTTYRLTEQHAAGGMSRWLSHLAELQPAQFAELSPQLAAHLGITPGGWLTIMTRRGVIEARALVTRRAQPLFVGGRVIHQVSLPIHYGAHGLAVGDSVNDLIPMLAEPNVMIHEAKALTCAIRAGRRPRGAELVRWLQRLEEGKLP